MTTSEPRSFPSGGVSQLEADLAAALAVDLPASVGRTVDERIRRAILDRPGSRPLPSGISWPSSRRRLGFVVALAASAVVLVAAGTSILGTFGSLGGTFGIAWDRAERLELTQTVNGFRVTIHRAYADANQLMLAVSAAAIDGREASQVSTRGLIVRDDGGREYRQTHGGSTPVDAFASADTYWFNPPTVPITSRVIHLAVVAPEVAARRGSPPPSQNASADWWQPVAGPWRFEFDVPVASGSSASVNQGATDKGVTLRLASLTVSQTLIRARLELVAGTRFGSWTAMGSFAHAGASYAAGIDYGVADGVDLVSERGVDGASGVWTVNVTEVDGVGPDGESRITGDWRFEVTLP